MEREMKNIKPEAYWEHAGEISYASAMFSHSDVAKHVNNRLWQFGIDVGKTLGLNEQSHIIDLGCGDGVLANLVLSKYFYSVDGFDLSVSAIKRAQKMAANTRLHFEACDITHLDFSKLPQYDCAYLWGILHHVKNATPQILNGLRKVTKRIVILEPNGNHILRKCLEKTATYKAAGEDSFRTKELERIFQQAGYRVAVWKRLNLFPNFMPKWLFQILKPVEPLIENMPILRALCTVNLWGFIADEQL
jgi:cyclopropane fatty-acyl-phospholipid synthase-like methyltransferase